MTGKHTGHGYIRDNYELGGWLPWTTEGQLALPVADGLSFLPTLLGNDQDQQQHDSLYWEFHGGHNGMQAVRQGDWKAVRKNIRTDPNPPVELYDLATDLGETTDVSALYPQVTQDLFDLMQSSRTPSALDEWNFPPEY